MKFFLFLARLLPALVTCTVVLTCYIIAFLIETVFAIVIMPIYILFQDKLDPNSELWPGFYPYVSFSCCFGKIGKVLSWLVSGEREL